MSAGHCPALRNVDFRSAHFGSFRDNPTMSAAQQLSNNGFCTQIGNAHFTAFATTTSKSRLNFLSLLRAGHGDYVVNGARLRCAPVTTSRAVFVSRPQTWDADDDSPAEPPVPRDR